MTNLVRILRVKFANVLNFIFNLQQMWFEFYVNINPMFVDLSCHNRKIVSFIDQIRLRVFI